MRSLFVCAASWVAVIGVSRGAPSEDWVSSLPDYGPPPTVMYSGYLDGTDGCNTTANGDACMLHYWYAAAEHDEAEDKPVILWLNGGPGSTSIIGFLEELGPLLMNATGGLMQNPYSWTRAGHVLVLESPVGVGYSYCTVMYEAQVCQNTDKFTASTARAAMVDFFTNKFPELATRDFYITGESYAGVYIPTLAREIVDHASDTVNLVGLAVGDPCTDQKAQQRSMDALWYGHKYGLVPDQQFDLLWYRCGMRMPVLLNQHDKSHPHPQVQTIHPSATPSYIRLGNTPHYASMHPGPNFRHTPECTLAYRKFLLQTSAGLSQSWHHLYINDYSLFGPGGYDKQDVHMAQYMNRPDVRQALHVQQSPTTTWPMFDKGFDYTSQYAACNWEETPPDTPSMVDFYRYLAPRLKGPIWVYNGDTDPCVTYEGTRTAMERVGYPEVDGGSYRPWFYNHTAADARVLLEKDPTFGPDLLKWPTGPQMGGEIVNYQYGLAFLTFHGSGHMVPQFRPQAALHMIRKLVGKKEEGEEDGVQLLSPKMPDNETLASITDEEFRHVINKWTKMAKAPPYVEVEAGGSGDNEGELEVDVDVDVEMEV